MAILAIPILVGTLLLSSWFIYECKKTDSWSPVTSTVLQHSPGQIVYGYELSGNRRYQTTAFNYMDMAAQKMGMVHLPYINVLHPELGSYEEFDGVVKNPAVGETKTVYFNPASPDEAVVYKGMTSQMWVVLLCLWGLIGVPMLGWMMGWGVDMQTDRYNYDVW